MQRIEEWIDLQVDIISGDDDDQDLRDFMEGVHAITAVLRVFDRNYPEIALEQANAIRNGQDDCIFHPTKKNGSRLSSKLNRKSDGNKKHGADKAEKEEDREYKPKKEYEEANNGVTVDSIVQTRRHRAGDNSSNGIKDDDESNTESVQSQSSKKLNHLEQTIDNSADFEMCISESLAKKCRSFLKLALAHVLPLIELYPVQDLLEYDPSSGIVPITASSYCNTCGHTLTLTKSQKSEEEKKRNHSDSKKPVKKHSKNSKKAPAPEEQTPPLKCDYCESDIEQCIDYFRLTAPLCWCYIFRDSGLNLLEGSIKNETLNQAIEILPTVRSYRRIDEMLTTAFKTQCYFITHLIYAFSDYGQHALKRELFAEEFSFIIENMEIAIEKLKVMQSNICDNKH